MTADEIVEQPAHLLSETNVDPSEIDRLQMMFMSMGEPLLHWAHLEEALRVLHQRYPTAALLISTSGPDVNYAPLRQLSVEIPTIGLQFSVHETTDAARDALIPFKRKLSLAGISAQGAAWRAATGRAPFFNYCVHENNNTDSDVAGLVALFNPAEWQCTISVVCERDETVAAANERQRQLADEFAAECLRKDTAFACSTRQARTTSAADAGNCGSFRNG